MLENTEAKKRRAELNRRALFSIKTGSVVLMKKYMFEILEFEANYRAGRAVLENEDFKKLQDACNDGSQIKTDAP